ncbi:uncharacterized protein LOC126898313 [Daktulosphaira vitifoliae]|uniref:uncharacterized protein LOC126898313 n=1 Tax=Daktulosphaira vitifoliae TaxID=58002 RepID=UPI0021AA58AD|nr:uncharacterized protein LOC126898313 [Daktulosphaira vitifoliae]
MIRENQFSFIFIWFLITHSDCQPQSFGTTRFNLDDISRNWTKTEILELQYRNIVKSLIPKNIPEHGTVILEYFELIKKIAENSLTTQKNPVMLMVIDAFGGYLHSIYLANARKLYYEGLMTYGTAKKLHAMLEKFKYILGTDGREWMRPVNARVNSKMSVTHMIPCPTDDPCAMLKFNPDGSPMIPFFDDRSDPHTIIIPYAKRILFNLQSGEFYDQLYNYYYLTLRCIQTQANEQKEMIDYKNNMHKWMEKEVVPLLKDKGKWYPGLWGVLCVLNSLNENNLKRIEMASILMGNNGNATDCFYNLNNISFFYQLSLMIILIIIFLVSVLSVVINNNEHFWIFIGSMLCIQNDISDI